MRKKISNSLSAKVFLWVFTALTLCSILIYGIVLIFVPRSYQLTGSKQFETNAGALFSALENKRYEEGTTLITNFCIENNAVAMLGNEKNSVTFGDFDNIGDDLSTAQTYTTDVTFLKIRQAIRFLLFLFPKRQVNCSVCCSALFR